MNIRKMRDFFGLTQDELARVLGVSVATVSRCERLNKEPKNVGAKKNVENLMGLIALIEKKKKEGAAIWLKCETYANGCLPLNKIILNEDGVYHLKKIIFWRLYGKAL